MSSETSSRLVSLGEPIIIIEPISHPLRPAASIGRLLAFFLARIGPWCPYWAPQSCGLARRHEWHILPLNSLLGRFFSESFGLAPHKSTRFRAWAYDAAVNVSTPERSPSCHSNSHFHRCRFQSASMALELRLAYVNSLGSSSKRITA